MKVSLLFILLSLNSFGFSNFGIYKNENCFIKISKPKKDLLHIQFAHIDYHTYQSDDSYYDRSDFHPDKVLGTNILFDLEKRHVVFGPDKCSARDIKNFIVIHRPDSFEIKCGSIFYKSKASLKVSFNEKKDVTSFHFLEKHNPQFRGWIGLPFRQKILFDFNCTDLSQ